VGGHAAMDNAFHPPNTVMEIRNAQMAVMNSTAHVPAPSGGVAMGSVSHPFNVVMETRSVLMVVMNSTAVSSVPNSVLNLGIHAT